MFLSGRLLAHKGNFAMRLALGQLVLCVLVSCGGTRSVSETISPNEAGELPLAPVHGKRAQITAIFLDATKARLAGELPKAAQLYEACLKLDPQNAAAMFELSKLYHAGGSPARALELAKAAQRAQPDNIWYRFLLADLYLQADRISDAVAVYRDVLVRWPDRYEVYFQLAGALGYAQKVDEARQVYRDLEARIGSNEEIVMHEFELLANAHRLQEARELLEKASTKHPEQLQYMSMLAEVYDELGLPEKALEQYRKVLVLDPNDSMTRIALAEHYYSTGKLTEAYAELRVAFADPDLDVDAKMQVLLGFYEMTRPNEASGPDQQRVMLERSYGLIEALELAHPESGKPNTIHGDFLLRDGKYPEAREQFRRALAKEQDKYPIWQQVLQLDLQLSDHAALHADALAAIERFPSQPEVYLYNGVALTNLRRFTEAAETLTIGRGLVVDNLPLEAQFWSSLGEAYYEAAKYVESDKAFDKALQLEPENPTTLNNYAYYLSVRGEHLDRARSMSRKSNELAPGQPSYLDTYAWVLFRMGEYVEARTYIEKALQAGGSGEAVLVEHYGDILYKLGEKNAAMEQWRSAQRMGGASQLIDRKVQEGTWVE
jgi:tetratricopeptide (TPR) repeat protein